jgi:hypothetical protein
MKNKWIVIDLKAGTWRCDRCKEEIKSPLPCRIDTAAELAKAFYNIHKKCKENTRAPWIELAPCGKDKTIEIQVYKDGLKTNTSRSNSNHPGE